MEITANDVKDLPGISLQIAKLLADEYAEADEDD
jgi:hypothetical protein